MEENENIIINNIHELAKKHESIKNEMIKIINASKILDEQYKSLESELYKIEEEYVGLISKLTK